MALEPFDRRSGMPVNGVSAVHIADGVIDRSILEIDRFINPLHVTADNAIIITAAADYET